ncbi:MAG: DUF3857 domain-containing protein [Sphingobacteriales bacterium]|nr:DUF3857 domain-containing protein [Sphingobacteriales bacterium]
MKNRFIIPVISFLLSLQLSAQTLRDKDAQQLNENVAAFLNEDDADFKPNSIPDKWKTEAGVIIAQKTTMLYDKKGEAGKALLLGFFMQGGPTGKIIILERERRKIMLNDKFSVDLFSELYFRIGDKNDGFGARVIHKDGKIENIDLSKGVKVEDINDVPSRFRSYTEKGGWGGFYNKNTGFYKIPVAGLQPGDIIEYAYQVFNNIEGLGSTPFIEFSPVYFTCNREFSVMKQKFIVQTDNSTFLNSKAVNGAPEFKELDGADYNTYAWEDANREVVKDTRFVNEYLVLPLVKFQVVYSAKEDASNLFIGDRGELKTSISPEELANKVNNIYNRYKAGSSVFYFFKNRTIDNTEKQIDKLLKDISAETQKEDKYVGTLYYVFRHVAAFDNGIHSSYFAYLFKKKLDERKIGCDIVITAPNTITDFKDIIFKEELEWLVRVKNKFIFNFSPYSNTYDLSTYGQGNKAYVVMTGKNPTAEAITLPVSQATDNISDFQTEASFDPAFENLTVTTTRTFRGNTKIEYAPAALAYTNVFEEDYKSYNGPSEIANLSDRQMEEYYRIKTEQQKNWKELKPLLMKKQVEAEYPKVIKYNYFRLMSDGRSVKKQDLKYMESYVLGDFTKKAGKAILAAIPSLIEGQLQIKQDERQRTYDIDVRIPRTLTWTINFTIPAGYTAEGLEYLNNSIDNETGSFISSAKSENGKVILSVKKVYKQKNISKDMWPKMLEWIDAAYNFSQKKIALKPL